MGDNKSNQTFFYTSPKVRCDKKKSEIPPQQQQLTSVEITYIKQLERYHFSHDGPDGSILSFSKYAIPVEGSGKFKLWVEYDQTSEKR